MLPKRQFLDHFNTSWRSSASILLFANYGNASIVTRGYINLYQWSNPIMKRRRTGPEINQFTCSFRLPKYLGYSGRRKSFWNRIINVYHCGHRIIIGMIKNVLKDAQNGLFQGILATSNCVLSLHYDEGHRCKSFMFSQG